MLSIKVCLKFRLIWHSDTLRKKVVSYDACLKISISFRKIESFVFNGNQIYKPNRQLLECIYTNIERYQSNVRFTIHKCIIQLQIQQTDDDVAKTGESSFSVDHLCEVSVLFFALESWSRFVALGHWFLHIPSKNVPHLLVCEYRRVDIYTQCTARFTFLYKQENFRDWS